MKILLPILISACLTGLHANAKSDNPATADQVEKKAGKARITYKGGDGSSFEQAVIIVGANNSMDGVSAEGAWLKKKYRNHEKIKQGLVKHEGKHYDLITIKTKQGKEVVVYFDISGFMGGN